MAQCLTYFCGGGVGLFLLLEKLLNAQRVLLGLRDAKRLLLRQCGRKLWL